jgi:hypothetical protein
MEEEGKNISADFQISNENYALLENGCLTL